MTDRNTDKTLEKVRRLGAAYRQYAYKTVGTIACEIRRIPAPAKTMENLETFVTAMPKDDWVPVTNGEHWGGDGGYAWFRGQFTVPADLAGKELWLKSLTGEAETLLFVNGEAKGMFDANPEISNPQNRLHEIQPLTAHAREGECFDILLESYAGHISEGCMPFEGRGNCDHFYPYNTDRVYNGLEIVELDRLVADFLMDFRTIWQLYETAPQDSVQRGRLVRVLTEVYRLLPQMPDELPEEAWRGGMEAVLALFKEELSKETDEQLFGKVGLIGHSHLDTAWQWPVRETVHKAARTFSNALAVMKRYPDYTFIQSSVLYIDWMKKHYPTIYEGIRHRTAEGRWEPNGGSWVECDNNIPGGEYFIRQFLRGQRYLRENLGYTADCFWQPDTFGYSAALPQILRGCGIRYFLTTKLSWNEANPFPYDSFYWEGMDGSRVLTHFNLTHVWPDPETLRKSVNTTVCHKDVTDRKLISYGFGDGGGGPSYSMVESARRVNNLQGLPRAEHTTVSAFMSELEDAAHNLPVYHGELYLELHRGALTQKHDIKRSNRKLEQAIRSMEMLNVHAHVAGQCAGRLADTQDLVDGLLLNQFHDILPGTCIGEVHDLAIHQNYQAEAKACDHMRQLLAKPSAGFALYNTLSWEWNGQVSLPDTGNTPDSLPVQRYTNLEGIPRMAVGDVRIPPLAAVTLSGGKPAVDPSCPFRMEGNRLSTPFATVVFDEAGFIVSFVTVSGREIRRKGGNPLNTFYMGEDIPALWDNWDIDFDQRVKMEPQRQLIRREIVSVGALQLRIRSEYALAGGTRLRQDMVFYSDTPRVDFETEVDWRSPHHLLKVGFDVDVRANTARHEMQFGYVERPTHDNFSREKSQFEVCNHKYTDLSDNRFGVAVLNDCKYGVSVDDSDIRLTLHKGGCRPDTNGDVGLHRFTYALLPHDGGFAAETVVRHAYALNLPPVIAKGTAANGLEKSLAVLSCPHVILETAKFAEDGDGYILRLYEAEGATASCTLKPGLPFREIRETDMLEDGGSPLAVTDGTVSLHFHPFEIKTLKLVQ